MFIRRISTADSPQAPILETEIMSEIEESVSGFQRRGDWVTVVEHGERVVRALHEIAMDEDAPTVDEELLGEFDEWRPKSHERLDDDVNEKTAQQASVGEGAGEQEGKGPNEDLRTASEKLAETSKHLDDPDEAAGQLGESIDYVARAADSAGRKAVRKVEGAVYRNVMTRMSPYYFDNGLVSANLSRNGRQGGEYVFEINVNDDELKTAVSEKLASFEDLDRWHVDTRKQTDAVEAVEGVEVPEETETVDDETTGEELDANTN